MNVRILTEGREVSYWSVIKYNPKKNCEDEFLENAERLENELGASERLSVWLKDYGWPSCAANMQKLA